VIFLPPVGIIPSDSNGRITLSYTDAVIQIWDEHYNSNVEPEQRVNLNERLADHWLSLYGWDIVERTLPNAIAAWLRKCDRETVVPDYDLTYLRNYVQCCLRSEKDLQLTKAAASS
jgi:hypothetical protein